MKIRCLVVDDEPLARQGLAENIADIEYLQLSGSAENVTDARKMLLTSDIDLLFLDINMPKISGIEFLKSLDKKPMVIIVSAYADHALEGFELDVLDYLLKPVAYDRFMKAVQKAKDYFNLQDEKPQRADYFFIKSENKFEKIFFTDVLYVEAADNYVLIYTTHKKYLTYVTIKIIEDRLPPDDFIKVHKSYIVSISKIKTVDANEVLIEKTKIPISRKLKEIVIEKIVNQNLIKR